MQRVGAFDANTVAELWPDASPRLSAFLQGMRRYTGGKPCKVHGDSERYVDYSGCAQCICEAVKNLRKDKMPEQVEYVRKWRARNAEYVRQHRAAYRALNKERINAQERERRQRKKANSGQVSIEV